MSFRFARVRLLVGLTVVTAVAFSGCGSGRSTLPSSVIVELPDGTSVSVEEGSGVPSLVNTTWRFVRSSGTQQELAFLTITFGPNGNLERFTENTIAQEVFGSEIIFDGQRHSTAISAIQYEASTYGAETTDGTGFSFEGRMTAFAGPLKAGEAIASATGTFDPDDPDVMSGVFAFSTTMTLISIPGAEVDEEFFFTAYKETD